MEYYHGNGNYFQVRKVNFVESKGFQLVSFLHFSFCYRSLLLVFFIFTVFVVLTLNTPINCTNEFSLHLYLYIYIYIIYIHIFSGSQTQYPDISRTDYGFGAFFAITYHLKVGGFTWSGHFTWIDVSQEEVARRGSPIAPTRFGPVIRAGTATFKHQIF